MTAKAPRPIRILHVVGSMNCGGIETWLLHVMRHIDRERFRMDFLTHTVERAAYDDEIESLGARVLPCLHPRAPFRYARNLGRLLADHGPYDVVHSHVHHFSGWVLRIARRAGVPVRVAHCHNDTAARDRRPSLARRGYLRMMERWVSCHATHGLAASDKAARALFGGGWQSDPRWRILRCAIDLAPFRVVVDREAIRAELGIPAGAFVLGHVGRFVEQKNHRFLVDIASEAARRAETTWLLLIGEGPLRPAIERHVADKGLADRVVFAGNRPDVARLMLGAVDAFAFPSLHEGLGLGLVEAQAAGLPCIVSDVVPDEADVVRPLVRRVPLSASAGAWADAIVQAAGATRMAQTEALAEVERSPFAIRTNVRVLAEFYTQALRGRAAA